MGDRNKDPFSYILDLSRIPPSQEQLLQRIPFVRYTQPVIVMLSPPDSQEGPGETPAEVSLPLASDDQQRIPTVDDVDVVHCVLNQAIDADAGSEGYIDFSGFSFSDESINLACFKEDCQFEFGGTLERGSKRLKLDGESTRVHLENTTEIKQEGLEARR